jgi:hypothetical protein
LEPPLPFEDPDPLPLRDFADALEPFRLRDFADVLPERELFDLARVLRDLPFDALAPLLAFERPEDAREDPAEADLR